MDEFFKKNLVYVVVLTITFHRWLDYTIWIHFRLQNSSTWRPGGWQPTRERPWIPTQVSNPGTSLKSYFCQFSLAFVKISIIILHIIATPGLIPTNIVHHEDPSTIHGFMFTCPIIHAEKAQTVRGILHGVKSRRPRTLLQPWFMDIETPLNTSLSATSWRAGYNGFMVFDERSELWSIFFLNSESLTVKSPHATMEKVVVNAHSYVRGGEGDSGMFLDWLRSTRASKVDEFPRQKWLYHFLSDSYTNNSKYNRIWRICSWNSSTLSEWEAWIFRFNFWNSSNS